MARHEQRAFIRLNFWRLLCAWLLLMSITPGLWWFVASDFLRGVVLGADLATATALVCFVVVQSTGTAPTMMGDEAEQWTAQELRKLGDWRLVNHFELSYGDIDHVAVGPAGVLVFETKWSARPWNSRDGEERQRRAVLQVRRSAQQLRYWRNLKDYPLPVRPVIVLWGGGTRRGSGPTDARFVDGVAVVAGNSLRTWMSSLEPVVANHAEVSGAVWDILDAQVHEREDRGPQRLALPMSVHGMLLRLGFLVAAFVGGFVLVGQSLSWTGSSGWTFVIGTIVAGGAAAVGRRWASARPWVIALSLGAALPATALGVATAVTLLT